MAVTEDLILDSYREDRDGPSARRVFFVSEINAPAYAVLIRATEQVGIRRGDPHPAAPSMEVLSIQARPATESSTVQAIVTVEYGIPSESERALSETGAGEVEFSVSVITETTFLDINGSPMIVTYGGFSGNVSQSSAAPTFVSNRTLVSADVDRPVVRATVRRKEAVTPVDQIIRFGGTINSSTWSGFPPQTWLCAGIRSSRDGDQFMIYRDFLYRPETWRFRGVVATGEYEPLDATEGNGFAFFDVYPQQDFNRLGVSVG